jgi:exo-beta-1,3-glucanase (GH17 family)
MYAKLCGKALGKPIICSETAFPDGGEKNGEAIPSAENSARYFEDLYAWSTAAGVEINFFEAADEGWKGSPESVETHWGICDTYGAVKPQYWKSLIKVMNGDAANERQ